MAQISVSRALSKLKTLDDRIRRILQDPRFVAFTTVKGDEAPAGYASNEEYQRTVESLIQSYRDLVEWKRVVKRAVMLSNSVVQVNVAGQNLTIADVIELKTSIEYDRMLLANLRNQQTTVAKSLDKQRALADAAFQLKVKELQGNITTEALAALAPLPITILKAGNIDRTMVQLERFTTAMGTEIDAALSETNARTMIEVPTEPA